MTDYTEGMIAGGLYVVAGFILGAAFLWLFGGKR